MGLGRPWAIPILFSIIAYMYLLLICEWKINLSYYYYYYKNLVTVSVQITRRYHWLIKNESIRVIGIEIKEIT